MKSILCTIFILTLLTACGGGGGGGGVSSVSSSVATTLTANAGADITVEMGETVSLDPSTVVVNPSGFNSGSGNLEITGSSTKTSDIVKLKWEKQAGPSFGITTTDTTSGKFSFVAPATGTENSILITYQLTITNAAGQTASDSITITVNRVNAAPIANAGADQTIDSTTSVSLSGTASTDADGTLQSYTWAQTSGDAITLTDADKATATFTAPTVLEPSEYEFQLTVTDNDGATATDTVLVTIAPEDAPIVNIYFPTPVGVYKESSISVFGSAEAINADLSKIEISVGGDFSEATISGTKWRLNNIVVPNTDTFEIIVKATDSLGKVSIKKSELSKSDNVLGDSTWNGISALTLNYDKSRLYVTTNSGLSTSAASDVKLVSVDLKTVEKQTLSEFSNSNLGSSLFPVRSTVWARDTTKVYGVVSTSGTNGTKAIISIDTKTGQRAIISDSTHGAGTNFSNPVGIGYSDADSSKLYVTDNGANSIFVVDVETGDRTVAANSSRENYSYLISVPDGNLDLYTAPNYLSNTPFYSAGILAFAAGNSTFPDTSLYSQNLTLGSGPDLSTPLKALFGRSRSSPEFGKTLVIDAANRIFEIDTTTGDRTLLFTNDHTISASILHNFYNALFIAEDDGGHQVLSVIDLETGAKVVFAK